MLDAPASGRGFTTKQAMENQTTHLTNHMPHICAAIVQNQVATRTCFSWILWALWSLITATSRTCWPTRVCWALTKFCLLKMLNQGSWWRHTLTTRNCSSNNLPSPWLRWGISHHWQATRVRSESIAGRLMLINRHEEVNKYYVVSCIMLLFAFLVDFISAIYLYCMEFSW